MRYLTHITHFYDDLAPITIFSLGSIYDPGWAWLKCRKLNFAPRSAMQGQIDSFES